MSSLLNEKRLFFFLGLESLSDPVEEVDGRVEDDDTAPKEGTDALRDVSGTVKVPEEGAGNAGVEEEVLEELF